MHARPLLGAAVLLAACQHCNEPDVAGKSLTLPLAVSASGARYADAESNEFWTKGQANGLLTLAGQARRSCAAPSAAARDSALQ